MVKKRDAVVEVVLFDAFYEDGSQRSNRRVPLEMVTGVNDPVAAAKAAIAEQDREIAEKSGKPQLEIESVKRSRAR